MSALPPKADIDRDGGNVRFVPKADISSVWNLRTPARCTPPWGGGCLSVQTHDRLDRYRLIDSQHNARTDEDLTWRG
jgi:hypothetical protein